MNVDPLGKNDVQVRRPAIILKQAVTTVTACSASRYTQLRRSTTTLNYL